MCLTLRSQGELSCLFSTCHKKGKVPLVSLGPDWPVTTILIGFGATLSYYILRSKLEPNWMYFAWVMVAANLFAMFGGILGDPGVPEKVHQTLINDRLYDQAILD